MSHHSELIASNILDYLSQHEQKQLLRFITCGSVDDGKSTLIGRLLYDAQMVYQDQLEALQKDSKDMSGHTNQLNLALLVDGLQSEREQGITIDVAYRYFSTDNRKFIMADTPGHTQFTRNMVTGASHCDVAIILMDARYGMRPQTRHHSFIVNLLGIKRIIVAINKMDLVAFDQNCFDRMCEDYLVFAKQLGMHVDQISFIPISALLGDNVVSLSQHTLWYQGQPLLDLLNTLDIPNHSSTVGLRFPVQFINRLNDGVRAIAGTIASGTLKRGASIKLFPSGKVSSVGTIIRGESLVDQAYAGQAISITVDDDLDISRGDLITASNDRLQVTDHLKAMLVWMSDTPLLLGKKYDIKWTTQLIPTTFTGIDHRIDTSSLQIERVQSLALNDIAQVQLCLDRAIAFDHYQDNRSTGSFIVIDRLSHDTVGAGMIISDVIAPSTVKVTLAQKMVRLGQRPVTLLMTGCVGVGKAALAYALECKLFDLGRLCYVIDQHQFCMELDFSFANNRINHNQQWQQAAQLAKQFNNAGIITLAAFVAPDDAVRNHIKKQFSVNELLTVYVHTSLVQDQGVSSGVSNNNVGSLLSYDVPLDADIVINTGLESLEQGAIKILAYLKERAFI